MSCREATITPAIAMYGYGRDRICPVAVYGYGSLPSLTGSGWYTLSINSVTKTVDLDSTSAKAC